jgi:hypothetical protein
VFLLFSLSPPDKEFDSLHVLVPWSQQLSLAQVRANMKHPGKVRIYKSFSKFVTDSAPTGFKCFLIECAPITLPSCSNKMVGLTWFMGSFAPLPSHVVVFFLSYFSPLLSLLSTCSVWFSC